MGQNEDYSPGDSLSDSSKELLQRGGGEVSTHVILVKGGRAAKHTFWHKVAASHKKQMFPLIILVLF